MQGGSTVAATNWIPVMDDASLPEGGMQPAYPRGLNVVMARVDGKAYKIRMATIGHWNSDGVMDAEYLFWDNQEFMKEIGLGK